MDSKEANSSLVSGSSTLNNNSFSFDSQFQNGLNSETKIIDKVSGRLSNASDDGGFVSGEEEFETAPEQTVFGVGDESLGKGIEGEDRDTGEFFLDSSEFPELSKVLPVSSGSVVVDDVEKVPEGGDLKGEESGCGEGVGSGLNVAGGVGDSSVVDVVKSKGIGGKVFDEKPELSEGLSLNSSEREKEDGLEVSEGAKVAKTSSTEASSTPEEQEVEDIESKHEEVVADKKVESLNGDNPVTVLESVAKEVDGSLVEANGVKLTAGGDSVVEDIKVETPMPGVAVVGNVEENEEASGSVALVNGSEETSDVAEPAVAELVDGNGMKLTSEGDSVVEAIDVDMPVPGVAVVGKTEEEEVANGGEILINGSDQTSHIVEETVDKEVVGVTDGGVGTRSLESIVLKTTPDDAGKDGLSHVEAVAAGNLKEQIQEDTGVFASAGRSETPDMVTNENIPAAEAEDGAEYEAKETGSMVKISADVVEVVSNGDVVGSEGDGVQVVASVAKDMPIDAPVDEAKYVVSGHVSASAKDDGLENGLSDKYIVEETVEAEEKHDADVEGSVKGSESDGETDGMIFGSSEAAKKFIEELERGSAGDSLSGGESSQDRSQRIDGQIVTDSDEEVDTDEEGGEKEMFDLAALIKAATGGGSGSDNITITSPDGSRLFSVERPAGLGSSLQSLRSAARPTRSSLFTPSVAASRGESDSNLSEEEKKKLEKLQSLRVKFLRLVQRLGLSADESVAAQVLYRLALVAGRHTGELFSLDAAKKKALELEAEGKEDLDISVNIMVLGKSGVGKSATINSIFGEEKATINAFQPATKEVKEISGMVDGVKVRVFDTPGLKSSIMDQGFNRRVLSSAKKFTKKNPADIVLYVDRLDAQTRDLNDLPLLRTVTTSLGPSVWRSAIVTLTHAASAPPEGPSGSTLSYEVFVTQRSHVVQQSIGQAVGDLRMMSPSLMNPVSLVENHPSCRKNREGQKVLPNGQSWRPQLLLLCYSMKILSEANSLSKPQDPFDHRKLFGLRTRSPPLPYMLSSMLQSRAHPKLPSEQGGDNGDSDVDLEDLSDSDLEEDADEYDQLPPFKPLRKSQLAKLSKEQKDAYFEEYDYRAKLLQKKQWKEELKRMREMKKRGKDYVNPDSYMEEEADSGAPAPVAVPLPDMVLPPSFDSDNPAYRFRFLEPTSQFLARPVLDTHGWDHDVGYDGVNLEQSLAIASRYPAVVSVQVTKDKKDFSINFDSSISTKHGEKGSSMAGFDIQPIGKQLAYVVRGETKFKNLKKNKTAAGMSVTFLGENVVTGFKVEDQISFGRQYSLVGSAGTVRFQNDSAYGANIEVQRRELDYPIGQVQSTFGLSIIKWRGDLALGFNSLAQFSAGRGSKVAVRAGINNKMSGQITVRTSSSEHLSLALAAVIPTALSIYKKIWPGVGDKYSIY